MSSKLDNQTEILFIHLGPPPPKILLANVRWLKSKFPGVKINLATDSELNWKDYEDLYIHRFSPRSVFYDMKNSPHSTVFRKGYWLHTMRRLLAIEEFHRVKPNVPLLQIETDVLLLEQFPFQELVKIKNVAWPPVNAVLDAPSIVYLPTLSTSQWLSQKLYEQIRKDPDVTDMVALKRIATEYPDKHDYLPVGPSPLGLPALGISLEEDFDGVFDGTTLGRWLTGIDPRNKWGIVEKYKYFNHHYPEILEMQFVFQDNSLFFRDGTSAVARPVYNLHVFSKNLKLFSPHKHKRVLLSLVRKSRLRTAYSFSITGFLGALYQLVEAGLARLRKFTSSSDESSNRGQSVSPN